MIVECVSNSGADLPVGCSDPKAGIDAGTAFPLTMGKQYAVYAVTTYLGCVWYYVLNDDRQGYPVWAPASLFDVSDPSIPSAWHYRYHRYEHGQYPIMSFPECADDPTFYERLVDGDEIARQTFERYGAM